MKQQQINFRKSRLLSRVLSISVLLSCPLARPCPFYNTPIAYNMHSHDLRWRVREVLIYYQYNTVIRTNMIYERAEAKEVQYVIMRWMMRVLCIYAQREIHECESGYRVLLDGKQTHTKHEKKKGNRRRKCRNLSAKHESLRHKQTAYEWKQCVVIILIIMINNSVTHWTDITETNAL